MMIPRFVDLEPIWHVDDYDPAIIAALSEVEPEASQFLATAKGKYPVAATCRPFAAVGYERPVGHARSFYKKCASGGSIAVKGSEPYAWDLADCVRQAYGARPIGMHSSVDNFALLEHEAFLSVRRKSAIACAELSVEYTAAYLRRQGTLPHAPVPLAVLAIPDDIAAAHHQALLPYLSDRRQFSAANFTDGLLAEGLAIYVYYLAGSPIRLAHVSGQFPGGEALWRGTPPPVVDFDIESCVHAWCRQFAEMLALGFVPTTPVHTGNCMQSQNLTIDGGLTDIDSIERIDRLSPSEVFDGIVFSLYELTRSVLMASGEPTKEHVPATGFVFGALWSEIRHILNTDLEFSPASGALDRSIAHVGDISSLWRRNQLDLTSPTTSAASGSSSDPSGG